MTRLNAEVITFYTYSELTPHSTEEPLEQTRPDGCGEGGGKGTDQGESGGRNHACGHSADTGMPSDVNRIRQWGHS